jgi:phage FluMu gp28-like protein
MSAVTDDTASGKPTSAEDGDGTKSRRRPRVSARKVAHGAKVGTDAVRSRIASVVWIVAVVFAVILALAAVLVALGPANEQNTVVEWLTSTASVLAGPAGDQTGGIFDFGRNEEAKNALANWGIAAIFYLVVGRLLDRIIRP